MMGGASLDLALVWAGIIAMSVLIYVMLDGFDLGIGILFPFLGGESHQNDAMTSVAPVWDGNETWLVLGGGGLLAVFPLAYAIILPALYAPIMAMLLGLILRGVAFEYRWRTRRWRVVWDWSFTLGSFIAAFAQGITLGALIQGIDVANRAYSGGWWDWLSPFSVFTGLCLCVGYILLGSTWLIMKTEGLLKYRAQSTAWIAAPLLVLFIGMASLFTVIQQPDYLDRWISVPQVFFVGIVPLLVIATSIALLKSLNSHREIRPFILTQVLFILCFIGLAISFFPNIVPPNISLWEAAAPAKSLSFLLAGAVFLIPIILMYTVFSYWIFRGKVDPEAGYH